jgi:ubiquinone/menaquinone biosynthesis C-methylase UbiE
MKAWRAIGALLLLIVAVSLAWRMLSRRRNLPCPSWLAWSLSSRLTDWLAATEETLDWIGLEPGQRVLEIGPGPGRLLIPAARRVLPGGTVVGLDIQPGMIERLKARAASEDVSNLATVIGDASESHFPPESFDVVFLCTVLGEIQDRPAALAQCYRVLKPGGRLSITEIMPDPHYQSRDAVLRLAEAAGFRPDIVYGGRRRYTANFVRP